MKKRILALFLAGCVAFTALPMDVYASETTAAVEEESAVEKTMAAYEDGESFQEGNYTYTVLEDDTVCITKYTGEENNVTIPSEIDGKSVTLIGLEAFKNNESLVSVSIPNTVIAMDRDIFYGCTALENVELPDSVKSIGLGVFMNCSSLTTVELPTNLMELGQDAFKNCISLSSMTLPGSLEVLGVGAFYNCTNLTKINIPKSLTTSLGGPFMASGIAEVEFEEGIKVIPIELFKECDVLTTVTLPDSVTEIGRDAFYGCDALTTVEMPDGITRIGYEAFINCKKLTNVELPSSLEVIEDFAFEECNALTIDNLPSGLVSIGEAAFYNCSNISDITLPNTLEYLGAGAFCRCTSLKKINIPKSLTVDGIAFSYSGITEVELEEGITEIPTELFAHCQSLERVEIPYTVTDIGRAAFYGCTALSEVTIPSKTRYYGDDIFTNAPNAVIYGRPDSPANYYANAWGVEFVEYKKAAEEVTLAKTELILKTEESFDLGYTVSPHTFVDDMVWTSSDATIASVNSDGTITAVKAGIATITFTVGELSETCVVTVLQDVESIQLSNADVQLNVGDEYTLNAEVLPTDASNKVLEWKSSDTDVVTVDENGVLTAVGHGEAIITAKATDGTEVSATCKVTVPYVITYVLNGGINANDNPSIYYGETVVLAEPEREGYIFDGWYTEATFENRITEVTEGDITVYAKWVEIQEEITGYTIVFNGHGATSGSMSEMDAVFGETIKLPKNEYKRIGYTFRGWTTDEDGLGTIYADEAEVTNLITEDDEVVTLYAQWDAIIYTIVLDGNGATNVTAEKYEVEYDDSIILYCESELERAGYTFTGWNTKADGTGTPYEDGAFLENLTTENGAVITFYAQWEKDIYSISEAIVSLPKADFVYTGSAIIPTVRVIFRGEDLVVGKDYTINFANNISVGTATATITGMGDYTGTVTRTFTINKAHLDSQTITLSKTSYTYNGKTLKPTVTVKVNGRELKSGTDYTITYKNNKNIGTATVTIEGKGNYTGTVTKQFTIKVNKGTKITISKNKYEVTGDSTVKFTGTTSSSKTLTIPKTVKYGGKTFKVTAIASKALKGNKKVTKVTIGSNVTTIGSSAFAGCTKLTTVTIGNKVKTIGTSAFEGCKKLSKVTIGSAVTKIDAKAFKNCTGLKSITIPSKVTTYGKQAFYGCKNLKSITFKSKTILAAGKAAFKNIHAKATIKVPKKSYKQYKEMLKATGVGKKVKIIKIK